MIIDEELLLFMNNVSAIITSKLGEVKDSNILKKAMVDFCHFVEMAKPGDSMGHYMVSFVAAMNVSGLISTELAEDKFSFLRSHGVYGSWEKASVLDFMRGKSSMIDSWIMSVMDKPGDLVVPAEIWKEWDEVVELAKLEPVGGIQ